MLTAAVDKVKVQFTLASLPRRSMPDSGFSALRFPTSAATAAARVFSPLDTDRQTGQVRRHDQARRW
jgi:hypothetical protein